MKRNEQKGKEEKIKHIFVFAFDLEDIEKLMWIREEEEKKTTVISKSVNDHLNGSHHRMKFI